MTDSPPAPPALDDFHPPYRLGAFGCAIFGVWSDPPGPQVGPYAPMRWPGGGYLGAALVLRYDVPSPDYPVVYGEIILSYVVRSGARLAAMPFDLVLDNAFYVAAGIEHYHLPKRLDETLRIDLESDSSGAPRRIAASGADLTFDASLGGLGIPCAKGVTSALLRGFTSHVPILGTVRPPVLRTIIALSPDAATTRRAEQARITVRGRTLRPLSALFWRKLAITVGAPQPRSRD